MQTFEPHVVENREFVALEEEDIQKLNRYEAAKFDYNPEMKQIMADIAAECGEPGRWSEHWVTIDPSGRRVYAKVYTTDQHTVAVSAAGKIIRETEFATKEVGGAGAQNDLRH